MTGYPDRWAGGSAVVPFYEDEGHAFLQIENVIDAKMRQVAFLAKILDDVPYERQPVGSS